MNCSQRKSIFVYRAEISMYLSVIVVCNQYVSAKGTVTCTYTRHTEFSCFLFFPAIVIS